MPVRFEGSNMRHQATLRADRSNRCGDMAFFNFSRWRDRHLGFLKVRRKFQPAKQGAQT